jgi:hypothetical protein
MAIVTVHITQNGTNVAGAEVWVLGFSDSSDGLIGTSSSAGTHSETVASDFKRYAAVGVRKTGQFETGLNGIFVEAGDTIEVEV